MALSLHKTATPYSAHPNYSINLKKAEVDSRFWDLGVKKGVKIVVD
ncbi:hypothetical protein HMPREF2087_00222 [Helicobacter canis NCTC 12740]|uniref:Uncharacterized protein n=1 Tax=Helicobacter canis NCTC 12740 TaxID=1357399 RepID=V8CJV5_9HELI|nr:hypothetical protein HMPREF2087_00222 [Helicobacter canis NCTC 12740]